LTPTPLFSPLSLHDALPISHAHRLVDVGLAPRRAHRIADQVEGAGVAHERFPRHPRALEVVLRLEDAFVEGHRKPQPRGERCDRDRKSTRLNSSHVSISYAV